MTQTLQPTQERLNRAIDRFWETIPPLWNQVRENIRATAAEHFDISVEQFHILRHIRKGICSISALAEEKNISRPAVSQAVDLLVAKGLITRQQNTDDRRYVQLALTESGDELLNAIFLKNREWMMERLSSLNDEETGAILHAMDLLKKTFEEPANPAA